MLGKYFFHVYKEGVDLQNSKKFIKKSSKSICTQKIFRKFMFFHAFQKACSRK